jgi:hypothetical protein
MAYGGAARCVRCGDRRDRHYYGYECRAVDEDGRCPCPGFLSAAEARRIHETRIHESLQRRLEAAWKR